MLIKPRIPHIPQTAASIPAIRITGFAVGWQALICLLSLGGSVKAAAPVVGAVVSASSYSSGALVAGSAASIFGSNLASSKESAATFPLPTVLGGATVYINGVAAPLLFASASQINFQVPWEIQGQSAFSVVVTVGGAASADQQFRLVPAAPGIFTLDGNRPITLVPGTGDAGPVHPGEYVTFFATGLGAVDNQPPTGNSASETEFAIAKSVVSVSIGGMPAVVAFAGLVVPGPNPYSVGVYEVDVLVPTGVSAGSAVPLTISVDGVRSNPVMMAIASGRAAVIARWIELGESGTVLARAITSQTTCPDIQINGSTQAMLPRAPAALPLYPVLSCETTVPPGSTVVVLEGRSLLLPSAKIERITVIADTGCRMQTPNFQACNDANAWPVAQVAQSASESNPGLIIHNGDYHYRVNACPPGNSGCSGSPWGLNWSTWRADFFAPFRELLAAAPWVFVRGNHESCTVAGEGWFRYLDPRPMLAACPLYTDPISITAGQLQLINLDSAEADDANAAPDQVAIYAAQFDRIGHIAGQNSWLILHRPLWGIRGEANANVTLQAASNNALPPGVGLVLSGHTHIFETYSFSPARAPQLVVGNSGSSLSAPPKDPLSMKVGDAAIINSKILPGFGFTTMDYNADGTWTAIGRDTKGNPLTTCAVRSTSIDCRP